MWPFPVACGQSIEAVKQPANRYWTLQWYEFAIFLGVALILVGVCFYGVRRRLAC